MPPLPTSLQALVVPPAYRQTLAGQPFLMSFGLGNKFLLFTTVDNLTRLCQYNTIYVDAHLTPLLSCSHSCARFTPLLQTG
jgi:hypothetical protein